MNGILSMVGLTALLVVVVDLLKAFKVVKDGQAPVWTKALNAFAYIAIFVLGEYFPQVDLGVLDSHFQQIANLGFALLGLVPLFAGVIAPAIYSGVKGIPIVGFSNSDGK